MLGVDAVQPAEGTSRIEVPTQMRLHVANLQGRALVMGVVGGVSYQLQRVGTRHWHAKASSHIRLSDWWLLRVHRRVWLRRKKITSLPPEETGIGIVPRSALQISS
jgi:hypothetical protein